jgi:hypothetical protein
MNKVDEIMRDICELTPSTLPDDNHDFIGVDYGDLRAVLTHHLLDPDAPSSCICRSYYERTGQHIPDCPCHN